MSYARPMLDSYPGGCNVDAGVLAATSDALIDCGQASTTDADAICNGRSSAFAPFDLGPETVLHRR
jgi:hypothetical protein